MKKKLTEFFQTLGSRFSVGRDFNTKYTFWGSRFITIIRRDLLKSVNETNWDLFRSILEETISFSIQLRTVEDIKIEVNKLTNDITNSVKIATPVVTEVIAK